MRQFFGIAAAIGAAVALSGCLIADFGQSDRYQNAFHYSYDLSPGGRLDLQSSNGAIEITGWDQDNVEITGVKYGSSQGALDSVKIEIRDEPDFIDIRAAGPSEPFINAGARFTIRVPRKAVLERIVTTNGQIRISGVESGARLKTSNGSIRVENVRGRIDAQTTNGRIHAEDIDGECEARTSNGSIDLTFARAPEGDVRAKTSNGAITVRLPADTAARLKADTSNSSITTDLDMSGHVHESRNHLDGTIGAGGPLIELATSNGHISLLRI